MLCNKAVLLEDMGMRMKMTVITGSVRRARLKIILI